MEEEYFLSEKEVSIEWNDPHYFACLEFSTLLEGCNESTTISLVIAMDQIEEKENEEDDYPKVE